MHFLFSNFKSLRKESGLIFKKVYSHVEIWPFYDDFVTKNGQNYHKMVISRQTGKIKKNKGTFFSRTLKVREKKVALFFWRNIMI